MGVQFNIKDPETVRLARQLADESGRSVTETIREALRKEHATREAEIARKMNRLREISAEFRAHMPAEWHGKTSKEIMDSIYDEDGLPI